MDEIKIIGQEGSQENQEAQASIAGRLCYLCGATLDANKACTDQDCPLFGIPQE